MVGPEEGDWVGCWVESVGAVVEAVGAVEGVVVGEDVNIDGAEPVGEWVGWVVGAPEGATVLLDGDAVEGDLVGLEEEGVVEGEREGDMVGPRVNVAVVHPTAICPFEGSVVTSTSRPLLTLNTFTLPDGAQYRLVAAAENARLRQPLSMFSVSTSEFFSP